MKNNKSIISIMLVPTLILLIPLLAMQVTEEVAWDLADFTVAWSLMAGVGLIYRLAVKRTEDFVYRSAVGVALATAFFLIWVNLSVGIIGPEGHPANLMYVGVLAVGIIGAARVRLQPIGMARALFATALAQALVAAIALIAGAEWVSENSASQILGINTVFVLLFLFSARLFRKAALKNI